MKTDIETESAANIASSTGSGAGAIGAIVAAMGCANCFPAIAALGASLGLGWLDHYEG
jgi:mercuric ion transport protein